MKKFATGLIELLITFLLLSIIVAIGMRVSLDQMEQYRLDKATTFEKNKSQVNKKLEEIQDIKNKRIEFEETVINSYGE